MAVKRIWEQELYLLKAIETSVPTDPWGDMRGLWWEKNVLQSTAGTGKIFMKPCRLRNGSPYGRAFLAKNLREFAQKSANQFCDFKQ